MFFLNFLTNSKKEFYKIVNEKIFILDENHKKIFVTILLNLKKKLIVYYVITFILIIFFWFYTNTFCSVYRKNQISLIINFLISFVINITCPFIFSIILSIIRYISINKKLYYLYVLSLFINIIL